MTSTIRTMSSNTTVSTVGTLAAIALGLVPVAPALLQRARALAPAATSWMPAAGPHSLRSCRARFVA